MMGVVSAPLRSLVVIGVFFLVVMARPLHLAQTKRDGAMCQAMVHGCRCQQEVLTQYS